MLYTKDENVYAQLKLLCVKFDIFNVEQLFEFEALFQLFKYIFIICILHSRIFFVVNHYVFSDPSRYC